MALSGLFAGCSMSANPSSLPAVVVPDAEPVSDRASSIPKKRGGGPRTPAGKRRSAVNALRSGLYADAILIKGEDSDEYLRFARAIVAGLDVKTALEMAIAERIVSALWRSRRARRYERAHLNGFHDEAEEKRKALERCSEALADHERNVEAVQRLGDAERMTADDFERAAAALYEVFEGAPKGDASVELPSEYWDLWPTCGTASRKRVARIAEQARALFAPVFVGSTVYEFGFWVFDRMGYAAARLRFDRDEAAKAYEKALRQTYLLDATQGDAYHDEAHAGRILEDAERRLDRQVSRAIADLEAARGLRPG